MMLRPLNDVCATDGRAEVSARDAMALGTTGRAFWAQWPWYETFLPGFWRK